MLVASTSFYVKSAYYKNIFSFCKRHSIAYSPRIDAMHLQETSRNAEISQLLLVVNLRQSRFIKKKKKKKCRIATNNSVWIVNRTFSRRNPVITVQYKFEYTLAFCIHVINI